VEDFFVYVGFWKKEAEKKVCYKENRIENPFIFWAKQENKVFPYPSDDAWIPSKFLF
jgi:hypothetical protein